MVEDSKKREIPSGLKSLLDLDAKVSKDVVERVNRVYPIVDFRHHMKTLEISCHGIPWLMVAVGGMYVTNIPELWVNLLLALILDIVVVAVLKAFTRRRRPAYDVDDLFMPATAIDKFSFPSGHATRAVLLAVFFICLYPLTFILFLPIVLWSLCVWCSRVLMGRHHVLDVACGIMIGLVEGVVLNKMWVSAEGAASLIAAFGGEDPWSGA